MAVKRKASGVVGGVAKAVKTAYGAYKKYNQVKAVAQKIVKATRRTKTKTKRKSRIVRGGDKTGANELGSCYLRIVNGRVPRKYRAAARATLNHQYGFQYKQTVSGQQWVFQVFNLGTRSQFLNTSPATAAPGADSWPANPFDLDPRAPLTAGTITPAATSPALQQVYFHTISGEIDVMNLETITTECTLYFYKYKKTTAKDILTQWSDISAGDLNQSTTVTQYPPTTSNPTFGAPTSITYGTSPFGHPSIRKAFKIIKTKKFVLNGGSVQKVKFNIAYNRMLSEETLNETSSTLADYIGGWTIGAFIMARAAPVFSTQRSAITPGPVDLGVMFNYNCKFSFPAEKQTYVYRTDGGYVRETDTAQMQYINDEDAKGTVSGGMI